MRVFEENDTLTSRGPLSVTKSDSIRSAGLSVSKWENGRFSIFVDYFLLGFQSEFFLIFLVVVERSQMSSSQGKPDIGLHLLMLSPNFV